MELKMNERIEQLALECYQAPEFDYKKFAELVVKECLSYTEEGDLDFMKFMIKKNFGVEA
jgi:hypothetical protein